MIKKIFLLSIFITMILFIGLYYLPGNPSEINANDPYYLGFTSITGELDCNQLPVQGTIPTWLNGELLRVGPGLFEIGDQKIERWFDGFALVQKIDFNDGSVAYSNKVLQTDYYKNALATGKISNTISGNSKGIFGSFFNLVKRIFSKDTSIYDNANVNVAYIGDKFTALTEVPYPVVFDINSLQTNGHLNYQSNVPGQWTTAHPHVDSITGEMFNYTVEFGRNSYYHVYKMNPGSTTQELLCSIPVDRPSYMHSFSLTKNYIILSEIPFTVNPLAHVFQLKPFLQRYEWYPQQKSRFLVISRSTGQIVHTAYSKPFFMFHHINAYEDESKNSIVVDIVTYADVAVIRKTSIERAAEGNANKGIKATRFVVPFDSDEIIIKPLTSFAVEFPRINYEAYNMHPYRYMYCTGTKDPNKTLDELYKIDVESGKEYCWKDADCYPGEPIFIARPGAVDEDDGVIIAMVLNVNIKKSFILVLDAKTFTQLGKIWLPTHIPFALHGNFYPRT